MLVDGGVADNQGIEALLSEGQPPGNTLPQILLVSDASGQLEARHTISTGDPEVFLRVNDILQFQVRSKLIDRLVQWWKEDLPSHRYFAYTHLFLNLKDRGVNERLPAEMIPGVARIRTDLDQFSLVERDALMYHGYTLIDAQIRQYCLPLTLAYPASKAPELAVAPLFSEKALETTRKRDLIRKELEAGAQSIFLIRSLKKYPRPVGLVYVWWAVAWFGALYLLFGKYPKPLELTQEWIKAALGGMTSGWIGIGLDWLLHYAKLPLHVPLVEGIANLLGAAALAVVGGYVLAFPTYDLVRRLAMKADRQNYRELTGTGPTTFWKPEPSGEKALPSDAG